MAEQQSLPYLPYQLSPEEFEHITGYKPTSMPVDWAKKTRPGEIIYDDKGKDTGQVASPDSGLVQALKGVGAGAGQAVTSTFPSLMGLGLASGDYLASKMTGDSKSFGESMFTDEGRKNMQSYDENVLHNIHQTHPELDEAGMKAKFEEVRKHSPAYYDEVQKHLKPGLSFAGQMNKRVNDLVGEKRLPSEATGLDTFYNIAGGALPVPGSVVGKVANTAAGRVLSRIGSTPGGRAALNIAEVTTPLTINTPGASNLAQTGRFATNVAVGEATDQAFKGLSGEPTIADYLKNDDGEYDWKKLSALGVGLIGLGVAGYRMRHGKPPDIPVQEGMPASMRLEQNLPNVVGETRMGLSKLRDDLGAPETYARGVGVPENEVSRMRDTMELNTGAMPELEWQRRWTSGVRSDMSQGEAPERMRQAVQIEDSKTPGFSQAFSYYDAIRNRLFDEERALTSARGDLAEAQKALVNATTVGTPNGAKILAARRRVQEVQQELAARTNDSDPNLRPSLETLSTADAKAKIAQIKQQFPNVEAIHQKLREEYKADIDIAQREGLFTTTKARQLKGWVDKGLTHFEDNKMAGRDWIDRQKVRAAEWWEDGFGINPKVQSDFDTYRGLHDRNPRKGYINPTNNERNFSGTGNPEPRPNAPYDPIAQFAIQSMRSTKAIANTRARRAFFDATLQSQGNITGFHVTPAGAQFRFSEAQLNNPAIRQKVEGWLANKQVPHIGYWKNGEFHVYTVGGSNGRLVRDAMNFSPAATIPIANNIRKSSQQFLTGAARPDFALVAVPWDAMVTSIFRNADKYTFGPVSQVAMKLLTPGSAPHRILTSLGAAVDPWVMMSRLIPTATKRAGIALYANSAVERRVAQVGQQMLQNLTTPGTALSAIAQLPGGQRVMQMLATTMAKGHVNSWYGMMSQFRIGHANNSVGQVNDIIKSAEKYGLTEGRGLVRATWERYKGVLSAVHDTSKELFFSQNYKRLMNAYNGAIPEAEQNALINAVRKSAGDFQRSSGVQGINMVLSTTRYGNVIFQTQKYLVQAFKRDPVGVMTKIGLGVVMPKVFFDYQMTNWDQQARDYFWSQPADRRMGTYFITRPDIMVRRMMGEQVPFNPSYVYAVRIAPEMLPVVTPVIHGLLGLDLLPNNTYNKPPVPMDLSRDMGATLDQAFGVSSPVFMGEAAKAFGYDIRPGAMFRGDSPIQPLQEQSLMGIRKDYMSPGSDIPRAFYDVFNSLYGAATAAFVDGLNVGIETNARLKGKDPLAAIGAGAEEAGIKRASTVPFANNIFPDYSKRFIYTPAAEEVGKFLHLMRDKIEEQYKVETENRPGGGRPTRAQQVSDDQQAAAVAQSVDSPLLADLILDVHNNFLKPTSELGKLSAERAKMKATYDALMRGTGAEADDQGRQRILSPKDRYMKANQVALQVNAMDQARYQLYQEEWKRIIDENGTSFAQQFGAPLKPETLMKAVAASAQRAYLRVQPPMRVQQ